MDFKITIATIASINNVNGKEADCDVGDSVALVEGL